MKTQIQLTLLAAAVVYMAWGLALLLAPLPAHRLLSVGPYDPVTTAMFGVALVAFAGGFVIGARDPVKEIVRAAAVALGLIGFAAAFLMFIAETLPLGATTLFSLAVDLVGAALLFLLEARLDLARHTVSGKAQAKRETRRERKPVARRRAYSR